MSHLLLLSVAAALFIYLIYTYLVYPIFFSPLRAVPAAHATAIFSSRWITQLRKNGSQALQPITAAHAKKGPIIRLSPTEVSVSTYEAAQIIYIERGGFVKPQWWADEFKTFGVVNMVSMVGGVGSKQHAARKRDMGNVYSKSVLLRFDALRDIARTVLKRLRDRLDVLVDGEEKGVMDVYNLNGAVSADFVSAYLFGRESTDYVGDVEKREEYFEHHGTFLGGDEGDDKAQAWLENLATRACETASSAEKSSATDGNAVVYKQLSSRGVAGDELASELLDHFIAGAEAPRTILTYLQWELCKHPAVRRRLYEELAPLSLSPSTADAIPDFRALDTLPYLDAVLTETLRVYTPTPGPQHRLTPPQGATLHGYYIPANTQISACLGVLHRNAAVFPSPLEWMPERWLTPDAAKLEMMRRWFWPFNKGSRVCVGKDFALIVMKLIVFAFYTNYHMEVVEDEGMAQTGRFLAQPQGEKLVLRFNRV